MGRQRRAPSESGWYHVMNRGVDHQPVFFDDDGRVDFGRLLGVGCERFGVEVHAYCLMGNHFHLLVRCPDGGLSRFVHDVCAAYVRHVNDRHGRDGPLFRGRFTSVPVETDAHLLAALRYVHLNPMDLPGVVDIERYRWSSHRAYLGLRTLPRWMRTETLLAFFDGDVDRYRAFVLDEHDRPTDGPLGAGRDLDLDAIVSLVAEQEGGPATTGRLLTRTVGVLLADHFAEHGAERRAGAITAWLAHPSEGARRSAISRARSRAAADPALQVVTQRVARLIA